MQNPLIESFDISAKNRFVVGYITELKVKSTPVHDIPISVQGPPIPIHFRDK